MLDLLNALGHAGVYALLGVLILVGAFYVLDLVTPGTRLGTVLSPLRRTVDVADMKDVALSAGPLPPSYSAALVAAGWLLGAAAIVWTAIMENGESSLGHALGWTAAFGVLGVLANALAFVIVDAITPGSLGRVICERGPVLPLAIVAFSVAIGTSAIICASITG